MSNNTMNLRYWILFLSIYLASAAVIPKDAQPTTTVNTTLATDKKLAESKAATNKPAATSSTAKEIKKPEVKETPKKEDDPKPIQIPNDVDLQAGPVENAKKPKFGQLETTGGSSSIHFLLIVIAVIICACIAHTYRKKLLGFFIGVKRGTTRRGGGNVRYRRLSTGEAAIE